MKLIGSGTPGKSVVATSPDSHSGQTPTPSVEKPGAHASDLSSLEIETTPPGLSLSPLEEACQSFWHAERFAGTFDARGQKHQERVQQQAKGKVQKFLKKTRVSREDKKGGSAAGSLVGIGAGLMAALCSLDPVLSLELGAGTAAAFPAFLGATSLGRRLQPKLQQKRLQKLFIREPELEVFHQAFESGTPSEKAALGRLAERWLRPAQGLTGDARALLEAVVSECKPLFVERAALDQVAPVLELRFLGIKDPEKHRAQLSHFLKAFRDLKESEQNQLRGVLAALLFDGVKPRASLPKRSAFLLYVELARPSSASGNAKAARALVAWAQPSDWTSENAAFLLDCVNRADDSALRKSLQKKFFSGQKSIGIPPNLSELFHEGLFPVDVDVVVQRLRHYREKTGGMTRKEAEHIAQLFQKLSAADRRSALIVLHTEARITGAFDRALVASLLAQLSVPS